MSLNRIWRAGNGRGRPKVRLAGVAALAVTAAGCFWPAPGAGPDRNGHNPYEEAITPETVADLEPVWTARAGGNAVWSTITSDQAVHVSAVDTLFGFDTETGDQLWARTPDNPAPDIWRMGPATFSGGQLWSGSGIPNARGQYITELLDPATGEVVGQPGSNGLVDSVRDEGYVLRRPALVGSDPSLPTTVSITVRDSDDPAAGWGGTIALLSTSGAPQEPLTLGDDFVYHAGLGPSIDADGNVVERYAIRGYTTTEQPDACPLPDDIPITVTCPTWLVELDGAPTAPVLTSEPTTGLFVGTSGGTVHALDARTGRVSWSAPVGAGVSGEPAVADQTLYVPTADGTLVVLDSIGRVLWEADAGNELGSQPAVAGGLVFTVATDGTVHAFDAAGCGAETCEPLWSDSVDGRIIAAPAVSDGRLYVGTADGRLISYGLP